MYYRIAVLFLVAGCACRWSSAQEPGYTEKTIDTTTTDGLRYIASPLLSYAPETRLGIGVAGMALFRTQRWQFEPNHLSNATALFTYTLNKQVIVSLATDLYWNRNSATAEMDLAYLRYPTRYFGTGMFTSDTGELYTPDYYLVKAVFEHRVWKKIFAGPQMKIKYHYLVDIEEQGLLASDSPRGMEAGLSSGFGFSMRFDNRDNHYSTTSGQFLQIAWLHYSSAWLSNYQFNEWRFDARQFLKVGARSVLGFQLLHRIHDGYAPFHQLASLGGQSMLRGYYEGRFRDKYALAVQTEYRMPVWGDLGFAVFAASGTVASDWVEMFRSVWKPAGGVGFRYRVMRWREGVLRFDVAVNAEGKVVWYAFFSEAF